ncbi:hypothetical protein J5N97_011492 [Dioscorea zingiberensis]|uniref:CCHC-type domain-containing protein n=1 Tax=Dioscorea zingiberensis TaxID=325984 RepID=A0A9D5HPM3_9LILI|nr:hypothetical protein J5N97_011492 [Dioscorea zingiberensis]
MARSMGPGAEENLWNQQRGEERGRRMDGRQVQAQPEAAPLRREALQHRQGEQRLQGRPVVPTPADDQRRTENETERGRRSPSFMEVLTGRTENSRNDTSQTETHMENQPQEAMHEPAKVERPWTEVRHKKKRRTPPLEERSGHTPTMNSHQRRRHSPPRKRTSSGVVEVCGRCRRPGHMMNECRRVEVYRPLASGGPPGEEASRSVPWGGLSAHWRRQATGKTGKARESGTLEGGDLPGREPYLAIGGEAQRPHNHNRKWKTTTTLPCRWTPS